MSLTLTHDEPLTEGQLKTLHNENNFMIDELQRHQETYDTMLYEACEEYLQTFKSEDRAQRVKHNMNKAALRGDSLRSKLNLMVHDPLKTWLGTIYFACTSCIVMLSVITAVLETVPSYNQEDKKFFDAVEFAVTIFFSVELVLRFFASKRRTHFLFSLSNLACLISISPYYVRLAAGKEISSLRVLRLFLLLNFARIIPTISVLVRTMQLSIANLVAPVLLATVWNLFLASLLFFSEGGKWDPNTGAFMIIDCLCEDTARFHYVLNNPSYDLGASSPAPSNKTLPLLNVSSSFSIQSAKERGRQVCPKVVAQFTSIPHAMWWVTMSMLMVGSDTSPKCGVGKLIGSVLLPLLTLVTALPLAIIGNHLSVVEKEVETARREDEVYQKRGGLDREIAELAARQKFSPGEALLRHMHECLHVTEVSTEEPSADLLHLLDEYFCVGCPTCSGIGNNAQTTRMPVTLKLTDQNRSDILLPSAIVEWTAGLRCKFLSDPDIVIPSINAGATQRQCVFTLDVTTQRLYVRPLTHGDVVIVNGKPLGAGPVELFVGDTLSFATPARCGNLPPTYKVEYLHPKDLFREATLNSVLGVLGEGT